MVAADTPLKTAADPALEIDAALSPVRHSFLTP